MALHFCICKLWFSNLNLKEWVSWISNWCKVYSYIESPRQSHPQAFCLSSQTEQRPTSTPSSRYFHKSLSAYLFLDYIPKLGKPKEFIEMKVQVKRAFKNWFLVMKTTATVPKQTDSVWNFLIPLIPVGNSYLNPLFQNQHPLYSVAPFFPKNMLNPRSGLRKWETKIALITALVTTL